MTLRILIVDDHAVFRDGLRALLGAETDLEVVGEAADGPEAVRLAAQLEPDLLIMDVGLPGLDGIGTAREILRDRPRARVLGCSMTTDLRTVSLMFKAGARGYVLKESTQADLLRAIRAVAAGHTFLDARLVMTAATPPRAFAALGSAPLLSRLTDREIEVLRLLANGLSTREIAERLRVSPKTVETHRANLMTKLNLFSIAELTKYAIRHGLVSPDLDP